MCVCLYVWCVCVYGVCMYGVCVSHQVSESALALNETVEAGLVQLELSYQEQADYVSLVQKLQGQLDELLRLLLAVPFWSNTQVSLETLARSTAAFDWYR